MSAIASIKSACMSWSAWPPDYCASSSCRSYNSGTSYKLSTASPELTSVGTSYPGFATLCPSPPPRVRRWLFGLPEF